MIKDPRMLVLALAFMAMLAPAVSAHSPKELETMLGEREKYFQPIDKAAPRFALQDAEGRPFSGADFAGKVLVLHFIYAGCPDVCPLHADRIAEVQELVNQTPMRAQVQFVTITTDPANDTPAIMRAYGEAHGLDPGNWLFLTTRPEQPEHATRDLAEQFGHGFRKMKDGYQIHGIVTHVVDQQERWRANFHGLKFEPTNLVIFINALVNETHKPHGHAEPGLWGRIKRLFGS